MDNIDLSERARSGARAGFPWIAAVYAAVGVVYIVHPPIEPGWLYAALAFFTSSSFVFLWAWLRTAPTRLLAPLTLAAALTAIFFALAFVGITGDAGQTTTLLITLLGIGCLVLDLRTIVISVLAGTLGWIALLPLQAPPPAAHWSIDLVATALLAIVVTAVRRSTFVELEILNRQNRLLVDSAGEAIYGVDAAGLISFVNPVAERVLGRSQSELLRQLEHPLLHLEPRGERVYPAVSCPFCHPALDSFRTALPLRRPSGEIAWVELTRTDAHAPDALRAVVTMRDVTEQTWTQRALRASEEKNRLVVDTALDGVVSMDRRGRIVGWNRQAERIFGWTRSEVVGQLLMDWLVPPSLKPTLIGEAERYGSTGDSRVLGRRLEARALRKNGEEFPIEFSTSSIGTDSQQHYTAFVRDITERVEAAERLRESKEAAEAAAEVKTEFLATMSHEIRTPLNGIFGMTELAIDTTDAGERSDFLNRARSCAQSLMTILNDVLDFSKIEAGHLPLERIEFEPESLLDGVIDTLAAEAQRKGLELIGCLDQSVPDRLIGDPGRLRQVLVNLGGNAIKFTERGEVLIRLFAEPTAEHNHFMVSGMVRDTGVGIRPEHQSRIFEAFTQADSSTTRQYGGTGLGLTIAHRLVDVMDGTIGVDSVEGTGSVFSFSVPLAAEGNGTAEAPPLPRGFRILVVDDNEASRRHLLHRLREWGCYADGAAEGTTACTRLNAAYREGSPYGLVLIDLDMPDPDGVTVARWIRGAAQGSNVPMVALTPLATSPEIEVEGLGFQASVTKPIKQKQFRSAMTAVFRRAGHRKGPPVRAVPRRTKRA
ncbi:MAG: PAS domain S-box protein [Candidatus Binatia bacterium]|nr:PAS domain S-box protein [Candidatus Binatia bacterium]